LIRALLNGDVISLSQYTIEFGGLYFQCLMDAVRHGACLHADSPALTGCPVVVSTRWSIGRSLLSERWLTRRVVRPGWNHREQTAISAPENAEFA
jgi:hypothetical protein